MKRIHFLTALSDKVGKDFIVPLIVNQKRLREFGWDLKVYFDFKPEVFDCDVFCFVSSFIRAHRVDADLLEKIKSYFRKNDRAYFFDVNDSTGAFYRDFFDITNRYYKKQLLRERSLYMTELYSGRYVFDYYHQKCSIEDDTTLDPVNVTHEADLSKIRLSWNVGLGDYYRYWRIVRPFVHGFSFWFPDPDTKKFVSVSQDRPVDVLGCFSLYEKGARTIGYHRKQTLRKINDLKATRSISSGFIDSNEYYRKLSSSKLVVCPYGYGEISWKDFEAFINGALVVKPDMSFMETWPNYYQNDKTYAPYKWDFSDLEDKIEEILNDDRKREAMALEGQSFYRSTINEKGKEAFCEHFDAILK